MTLSSFVTEKGGYDRNHGPIPKVDPKTHRIKVEGDVTNPLSLSVHDLSTFFPQHTITCVLQCAGNRRHTMRTLLKEVDGIDWGDSAVMNCTWRGPLLRDVLQKAVFKASAGEENRHVEFACYQTECQDDSWYGASIELWRALSGEREVMLALEACRQSFLRRFGESRLSWRAF